MATTRLDRFAAEVHAQLAAIPGANVPHTTTRKALDEHQPGRRMAWVSVRGQIKKAIEASGGYDEIHDRMLTNCAERYEAAYVYLYAETAAVVEQMLDNVIPAILRVRNAATLTDYRWVTQELRTQPTTNAAQTNQAGGSTIRVQCIEVALQLAIPVVDDIVALSDSDPVRGDELVYAESADFSAYEFV